MKRALRLVARLYPRFWRQRYGAEFDALLEETSADSHAVRDVFLGAVKMQVTTWSLPRVTILCAIAGGLIAAGAAFTISRNYASSAVIRVDGPDVYRKMMVLTHTVLSTDSLTEVIQRYDLNPSERSRVTGEELAAGMRRSILVRPISRSDGTAAAFSVEFRYSDAQLAQRATQALEARFIDTNVGTSPRALTLELLDHATLPDKPLGMTRMSMVSIGLFAGTFMGMLISFAMRHRRRRQAANLIAVAAFFVVGADVQAQSDLRPKFEVASIKPSSPSAPTFIRPGPAGRIDISNNTLSTLIALAYGLLPFQISGGPRWLDSARFDISAKAPPESKPSELPLMLQSLLADRFQLEFKQEVRELPTYELVLARNDGKLGPSVVESAPEDCTPFDPARAMPAHEPEKPPINICGSTTSQPRMLKGIGISLAQFAPLLSHTLGRTVIDKTGLTGKFNLALEWTPEASQTADSTPAADSGPSIFTALREQLGLKLESKKGQVEVFVIIRAEKPSQN